MTVPWSLRWSFCFLPLLLTLSAHTAHAAPDFSRYLHTILKNHTAHACEGSTLVIECPSRTSVAVLSAFYGRRVPYQHLCPSANTNTSVDEDTACTSPVAIDKVLSECQDRRSCHIPVFSAVFGQDPCPLTSKYLLVSYKCRPEHHRTRLVCENERLRLVCKNETVLAIYSASFGHLLHGSPYCPQEPGSHNDMECLSALALRKVSRRCHGRANCSLLADTQNFGDPCFPGTRKHLRVSFTCVPQYLLEDVGRGSTDPFLISDYTHDLPEKVALYFVSGICAGLVFLLCLFGIHSTLVRDVKDLVSDLKDELKASRRQRNELMEDLYDDEVSDTSSFCRLTKSHRTTDIFSPSTLAVEMVDRGVERMRDLPNGDIWPRGDSSPYAIHKIQTYDN
ncbi:protein eva-1 homolog C isoform X2 [Hippoglossus hippoglossus]|uniref:protein eva-1 homolog C isoform X2 n=1 Tax=Hippoglossus hippoglossus TaxID=8267 RepID=UPI00148CF459|nr:protein eva-1 homolog C isoform X2 [Hippoglossus hippoglossus]XP_035017762.1 protein eva-1 homolog C isoform X3 [Hippoglossus stenolepis]